MQVHKEEDLKNKRDFHDVISAWQLYQALVVIYYSSPRGIKAHTQINKFIVIIHPSELKKCPHMILLSHYIMD